MTIDRHDLTAIAVILLIAASALALVAAGF